MFKIKKEKLLLKVSLSRLQVYFILCTKTKIDSNCFWLLQCIHAIFCHICIILPEVPGPRPGGGVVSRLA